MWRGRTPSRASGGGQHRADAPARREAHRRASERPLRASHHSGRRCRAGALHRQRGLQRGAVGRLVLLCPCRGCVVVLRARFGGHLVGRSRCASMRSNRPNAAAPDEERDDAASPNARRASRPRATSGRSHVPDVAGRPSVFTRAVSPIRFCLQVLRSIASLSPLDRNSWSFLPAWSPKRDGAQVHVAIEQSREVPAAPPNSLISSEVLARLRVSDAPTASMLPLSRQCSASSSSAGTPR